MIFGITVVFILNTLLSVSSENDPDAYLEEATQIYGSILHKYNEKVRPPDNWPSPVAVGLTGTLFHIRNIDLMNQEMESLVELEIEWRDKRLAWYPYKVNYISTNVSRVWSPELIYGNAALSPISMLSAKVIISSEGYIKWKRREIITTLCATDPFKRIQTCSIDLKLASPGNQEYFKNSTTFTLINSFTNHQWKVNTAELKFSDENQTEINYVLTLYKKDKISQAVLEHESNCSMALDKINGVPNTISNIYFVSTIILVTIFSGFSQLL